MKTLKDMETQLKGQYLALNIGNESTLEELIKHAEKQIKALKNTEAMTGKSQEEKINRYTKDIELLDATLEMDKVNEACKVKQVFEEVYGEFNEENICNALVGIDWRRCKKLLALFGLEYDKDYVEVGYEGRTTAEHNYARIQQDLYTYEDILSSYTW